MLEVAFPVLAELLIGFGCVVLGYILHDGLAFGLRDAMPLRLSRLAVALSLVCVPEFLKLRPLFSFACTFNLLFLLLFLLHLPLDRFCICNCIAIPSAICSIFSGSADIGLALTNFLKSGVLSPASTVNRKLWPYQMPLPLEFSKIDAGRLSDAPLVIRDAAVDPLRA
jgi:hypothetical protein